MSQRRQDARKAAQDRRRQERREARVQQRRKATNTRTTGTATATSTATVAPARAPARPYVKWGLIGAGAVALVAVAVYAILSLREPLPGVKFESNGNAHVEPGQPHGAYFSNPPTSGWHYQGIPNPGIYTNPVAPEGLGHFMEHGGVWVLYTCPQGCAELAEELKGIVNSAVDEDKPVALAPYPPQGITPPERRINVIAWQYMLSMDEMDRGVISEFIDRHACRYNPEGGLWCGAVKGDDRPEKTPESGGFNSVSASATAAATLPVSTSTPTAVPAGPAPPPAATGTPAR